MKRVKQLPKSLLILIVLIIGLILFFLALPIINPPQCPDNYTQAQVDASNCIVGANIGLGLIALFLLPTALVAAGVGVTLFVQAQLKRRTPKNK